MDPLAALGRAIGPVTDREVKTLRKQVKAVTEIMALQGVDAAPATPRELEWLPHRFVGLGLPAPTTV